MDFFISSAHAQAQGGAQGDPTMSFIMLGVLVLFMWLFVFRPQSKRQKEHREMVSGLQKGDEVTTAGGLLGKITDVKDSFVKIEIADNVVVTVQKHTVSTVMPKGTVKSA